MPYRNRGETPFDASPPTRPARYVRENRGRQERGGEAVDRPAMRQKFAEPNPRHPRLPRPSIATAEN